MCRPRLPSALRLEPYLRDIDQSRIYSNYGPLHRRLTARLARHFGAPEESLSLANSGTSALIGLILATVGANSGRKPLCICPSYSFVATAVAARACGYTPFFADIDASSWQLDADQVARLPQIKDAALVITVAPYGRMPDVAPWEAFSNRTGLPVVIDAAACFDTLDVAALLASRVPAIVSLHATKTFSTAEGGLIIGGDRSLLHKAGVALNFGFDNSRDSTIDSINGKISEYHAAIGLAELDHWPEKRLGFVSAAKSYEAEGRRYGLVGRIISSTEGANPYALYLARDDGEAMRVTSHLDRQGIGQRLWYGSGIHRQTAFLHCPASSLAETERLAPRLIGLPMADDLAGAEIVRIVAAVAEAIASG